MMKMTLPANAHDKGFKIEVDGEDITDSLQVMRLSVELAAGGQLMVEMQCLLDQCDLTVLPENVTINEAEVQALGEEESDG